MAISSVVLAGCAVRAAGSSRATATAAVVAEAHAARRRALRALLPALGLPARPRCWSASGPTGDGFVLESVASPSADVIDYYALDGHALARGRSVGDHAPATRRGSRRWRWPRPSAGSRTLVAGGRRVPLYGLTRSTCGWRWSGHDRADDRTGPGRVRGRAPRPHARGVDGAAGGRSRRRAEHLPIFWVFQPLAATSTARALAVALLLTTSSSASAKDRQPRLGVALLALPRSATRS